MIGQKVLLDRIDTLIEENKFPRFSIICGPQGYGKQTLCRYIAKKSNMDIVFYDNSVEDIRNCLNMVYDYTQPLFVVLKDGDSMSINAKNAILKLIEEPPSSIYIILLSQMKESLLETVRSRGHIFELSTYTKSELMEFCEQTIPTKDSSIVDLMCSVCLCPGDIVSNSGIDFVELKNFCDVVLDKLWQNELSGVLKIPASIMVKEDKPELKKRDYPVSIFVNSLIKGCLVRILQGTDVQLYSRVMSVLCRYRIILDRKGVSVARALDNMFVEIYINGNSRT